MRMFSILCRQNKIQKLKKIIKLLQVKMFIFLD